MQRRRRAGRHGRGRRFDDAEDGTQEFGGALRAPIRVGVDAVQDQRFERGRDAGVELAGIVLAHFIQIIGLLRIAAADEPIQGHAERVNVAACIGKRRSCGSSGA